MNTPDSIEKTRKKRFKAARAFLKAVGAKSISDFDDMPKGEKRIMVSRRVKDFDGDDNLVWKHPDNKSYPTNEKCKECKEKVVMSKGTKKMFDKAKKKGTPPGILCEKCFLKLMKKLK